MLAMMYGASLAMPARRAGSGQHIHYYPLQWDVSYIVHYCTSGDRVLHCPVRDSRSK